MHDNVRTVFERAAQVGRCHRVIDDQGNARILRHPRQGRDVGDHPTRIGETLGEDRLAARIGCRCPDRIDIVDVDEVAMPVEFLKGPPELCDRSAVEFGRCHKPVTRAHQREQGQHLGGVAG